MNFKKMFLAIMAVAMMIGFAGSAFAACQSGTFIYGASAQYNFWKAQAPTFLTTNCGTAVAFSGSPAADTNSWIVVDTAGNWFAVANKASYDGICSIAGDPASVAACALYAPTTCPPGQRNRPVFNGGGLTGALVCAPVTGGAADVQAATFSQITAGELNGPLGGGVISRDFTTNPLAGIDAGVLDDYNPVVVPFAFYVNTSVKVTGIAGPGNGITETVPNLSTSQIKLLFSGQIKDWSDLGSYTDMDGTTWSFNAKQTVVCMRHAGSGTHATLDVTQMTVPSTTGSSSLLEVENCSNFAGCDAGALNSGAHGASSWGFFFNDSTSGVLNCLGGSGTWGNNLGAVGYADADKGVNPTGYGTPGSIQQVALNGVSANPNTIAASIENGDYDFWTIENLYLPTGTPTAAGTWYGDLLRFAGSPANRLDVAYAQNCQMHYWKAFDTDPAYYRASLPACPAFTR